MLQLGTPMITAGDERHRTQGGNNNPYCLEEIFPVPWEPSVEADYLTSVMQQLAAVRREHAELFDGRWLVAPGAPDGHVVRWIGHDGQPLTTQTWHDPHKVLGIHYPPTVGRGPLLIALNGDDHAAQLVLPDGVGDDGWRVGIDTADPSRAGASCAPGEVVELQPFGALVLAD